jgi:hypothetical protein
MIKQNEQMRPLVSDNYIVVHAEPVDSTPYEPIAQVMRKKRRTVLRGILCCILCPTLLILLYFLVPRPPRVYYEVKYET